MLVPVPFIVTAMAKHHVSLLSGRAIHGCGRFDIRVEKLSRRWSPPVALEASDSWRAIRCEQ